MVPTPENPKPVKKPKSISHKLSKVLGLKQRKPKGNNQALDEPNNSLMPNNENEVDRLFNEAIESMALPTVASDRMRTLPIGQKWQIVQDWTAKQKSKDNSERTQPLYWVQKLHEASEGLASMSNEDARQLHVLMRGSDKEWLTDFHKEDGIVALMDWMAGLALDNQVHLVHEATRCLKCIMNNQHGMQLLLEESEAIDVLALCLDFYSPDRCSITIMILEMLSLLCWFSDVGHTAVLEAMEKYRRVQQERARYSSVMDGLKDGESMELQAACLTFINTLVSTSAALDDRVAVRNDFLALDLLVICHAIEDRFDALSRTQSSYGAWGYGDTEQVAAKSFSKQVEVFEGLMHSDVEETTSEIDLSSIDAVFAKLKENAKRDGASERLLHLMLPLLLIPGEVSISGKMWEKAEEALVQITALSSYKDLLVKNVDYNGIQSAQKQLAVIEQIKEDRVQLEAQVNQLTSKLAILQAQPMSAEQQATLASLANQDELKQQLRIATENNQKLEDKITQLQQDLVNAKSAPEVIEVAPTQAAPPVADARLEKFSKLLSLGMPREQIAIKMKVEGLDISMLDSPVVSTPPQAPPTPQVDPAYEKYFKLLKMGMPIEQVQMKAKADGLDPTKITAASPAPPSTPAPVSVPTIDPKYEKYFKLIKMGMPKEQVKLKMQAEGLDPTVLDAASGSTPSSTQPVASEAPKPAPLKQTTTAAPVVLSPKKSKFPPKKGPIPSTKLRGLYWSALPDSAIEGSIWLKMDETKWNAELNALEKEFGQDSASKSTAASTPTSSKPKVVHLVDPKRQQNCSIALSRFRMPPSEIKRAILALDDKILTLERVQILETMVPSAEEVELVKGYDGDLTLLGETEKFFHAVMEIPRLAQRLKSVHTIHAFAPRLEDARTKVRKLEKGIVEIQQAHNLVGVLEVVLAVGNYLNGGTARGGVYGFKLEILLKLTQVKATSSASKSLLHCIADLIAAKIPHASHFYTELANVEAASAVSLSQVQTDVQALATSLKFLESEISLQRDPFRVKMQPFITTAQADVASLSLLLGRIVSQFQHTARSFGVDPSKPAPEGDIGQWFFGLWTDFAKAYKQAVLENELRKKEAAMKSVKKTSTEPEDGGLFNQFSESLEGDAREIVATYRKRHVGPKQLQSAALQSELALKLARRRQSTQQQRKKN